MDIDLCTLPTELVDQIFSYLTGQDLARLSAVNHFLHQHTLRDHLWQQLVQQNVPGNKITDSHPFATFRELYTAHDPLWFLTRNKVWFCDRELAGKLVITRYDQRRGCIEGYQLLATTKRVNFMQWNTEHEILIHAFEPEVKLHLDRPVLQIRAEEKTDVTKSSAQDGSLTHQLSGQLSDEIPMHLDDAADTMFSNLILTAPLPPAEVALRYDSRFPYGGLWPTPPFPAPDRILGFNHPDRDDESWQDFRPKRRRDLCETAFKIRTWLEMRHSGRPAQSISVDGHINLAAAQNRQPWQTNYLPTQQSVGLRLGEEVSSYATLDPSLYTPTEDMPWKGIWVGDYSGHGCEFLLVNQVHPEGPPPVVERRDGESDEDFEQRKTEARIYRGRLEAIKLTGDPNVPRGEYTFVANDLDQGYVRTIAEAPFAGVRVVESRGHISNTGFLNDRYIESQLFLISTSKLAQHWVGFAHVNFFRRLDLDNLLVPR